MASSLAFMDTRRAHLPQARSGNRRGTYHGRPHHRRLSERPNRVIGRQHQFDSTSAEGRFPERFGTFQSRQQEQIVFQRLRDPVHDLIEFADTPFDKLVWSLLETPEFQRLRRIRQLGFSELVFPGACHSRFAHSLGVFHTARSLAAVLKEKLQDFEEEKAQLAVCAALVHDLGHGPFSHAFEDALGQKGKHEEWTERIIDNTIISSILDNFRPGMSKQVSTLFRTDSSPDIYSSIVSSQFDADRLDYMRRDKMMSGTQHAGIDYTWLLRNLEVSKIEVGSDEQQFAEVSTFVLGEKALWAGESYVLSLFHLYPAVYLHKATRGAEKLFGLMMRQVKDLCDDQRPDESGLPRNHPIIQYLIQPSLENYLTLDDTVVWGSLSLAKLSTNPIIVDTAERLSSRNLFKAIDVYKELSRGVEGGREAEQKVLKFKRLLAERIKADQSLVNRILADLTKRDPYKQKGYESPHAISRIHIMRDGHPVDLAHVSDVVRALTPLSIYRVYIAKEDVAAQLIIKDVLAETQR